MILINRSNSKFSGGCVLEKINVPSPTVARCGCTFYREKYVNIRRVSSTVEEMHKLTSPRSKVCVHETTTSQITALDTTTELHLMQLVVNLDFGKPSPNLLTEGPGFDHR